METLFAVIVLWNVEESNMQTDTLKKIRDIVEDHLSNIEIDKIMPCEDTHDHYLLGKWDLAQEINNLLIKNKREENK
jgi:hypothetical protein